MRLSAKMILGLSLAMLPLTVLARSTDEILQVIQGMDGSNQCSNQAKEGKDTKCFADAINALKGVLEEYNDSEQEEHNAWHAINDVRGVGTDFNTDHQKLHDAMKVKHDLIVKEVRRLSKLYNDALKDIRSKGKGQAQATDRPNQVSKEKSESARTKCMQLENVRQQRICIRASTRADATSLRRAQRGSIQ